MWAVQVESVKICAEATPVPPGPFVCLCAAVLPFVIVAIIRRKLHITKRKLQNYSEPACLRYTVAQKEKQLTCVLNHLGEIE